MKFIYIFPLQSWVFISQNHGLSFYLFAGIIYLNHRLYLCWMDIMHVILQQMDFIPILIKSLTLWCSLVVNVLLSQVLILSRERPICVRPSLRIMVHTAKYLYAFRYQNKLLNLYNIVLLAWGVSLFNLIQFILFFLSLFII